MQKITFLALGLLLSVGVFAQTWTLDKMHSQLNFGVTHMGINTVEGGFRSFDATITSSKDDLSDAVVELKADVGSINTGVDPRDNHLKSPDFFDAATFPTFTFKSTSFTKTGDKTYQVTGNLTLHGVTKPVTLNVTFNGTATNPMNKKTSAGFHISGVINRADFGIGTKFPDNMLSNDVNLDANTEFVKG
ncbi:YceI family protein [Dinghuibacter silviterrae]|uniref:Polyisoprenoid-binding protein YceI n=1 Tax=Dinghuibacter silviterrae TaxID=1539049 RepID=A0A4R8DSL1_9BACT|nr:YceI family protein [Dinghuibacter silviterrae]TDX01252.1 polyisoprenoid-binding protein YceI [Dinghuibacter silviterrae]